MCLAIGPMQNTPQGVYRRYWWKLARAPHTLLLFAALFHTLLLLLLQFAGLLDYTQHRLSLNSVLVYALGGAILLGLLLGFLPRWLHTSHVDYLVYGSSYNLVFIGLLLLEVGLVFNETLVVFGLMFVVVSWLVAANAIKWCFRWTLRGNASLRRSMLILLYLAPLALLFNIACLFFSSCPMSVTQLLYKDILLGVLLLTAFIALLVDTR